MERFELRDITTQDKNGIVYVARDSVLGRKVSIRRFHPFGPDGGGLEKEEALAFEIAAKRLSEIQHESLRSVIFGGTDPIDAIPYLVTEWVDGESLKTVLADENMEPALVIDVLRIALEMSIILSHVLGEEAVWVETEIESIVVGTQESGRGFTFWISPFKWLGSGMQSRKLSSIVALGEELTGWKKRLVSDQAGHGLGGWLKWLKNNPDASLHEALESLSASTGKEPPVAEEILVRQATQPISPKLKQTSSKTPLVITAIAALLVVSASLFYMHRTAQAPEIAAKYTEQEISGVIEEGSSAPPSTKTKSQPSKKTSSPATPNDATARVNALAEKLRKEADENSEKVAEQSARLEERIKAQAKASEKRGGTVTPEQAELIKTYTSGDPVKMIGTIQKIRTSNSGKSIYIDFVGPGDIRLTGGIAHERDFKDKYDVISFEKYIGKELTLNGMVFTESSGARYVKITSLDQITVGK